MISPLKGSLSWPPTN